MEFYLCSCLILVGCSILFGVGIISGLVLLQMAVGSVVQRIVCGIIYCKSSSNSLYIVVVQCEPLALLSKDGGYLYCGCLRECVVRRVSPAKLWSLGCFVEQDMGGVPLCCGVSVYPELQMIHVVESSEGAPERCYGTTSEAAV